MFKVMTILESPDPEITKRLLKLTEKLLLPVFKFKEVVEWD